MSRDPYISLGNKDIENAAAASPQPYQQRWQVPRKQYTDDNDDRVPLENIHYNESPRDERWTRRIRSHSRAHDELITAFESIYQEQGKSMDSEQDGESKKNKIKAAVYARLSLALNILLMAAKLYAFYVSESLSILASVVDTGIDFVSGIIVWIISRAVRNRYRYSDNNSKTRLEPLAIVMLSVMMSVAAVQIIRESIEKINWLAIWEENRPKKNNTSPIGDCGVVAVPPNVDDSVIGIMSTAVLLKLILFFLCRRVKIPSVKALARDHIKDFISNLIAFSCAFIASRLMAMTLLYELVYMDAGGAMIISIYIIICWWTTGWGANIDNAFDDGNENNPKPPEKPEISKPRVIIAPEMMDPKPEKTMALKSVHFATINNLPKKLVPKLHKLCSGQDGHPTRGIHTDLHNPNTFYECRHALAEVIETNVVKALKESEIYGLILEEAKNMFGQQYLVVYIRFLDTVDESVLESSTDFLGLLELRFTDAQSIASDLLDMLRSKDVNVDGLVGVVADGSSEMIGCKTDVINRLREAKSGLLANRCLAHKLDLECGLTASKVTYMVKFKEIMQSIYVYYDSRNIETSRPDPIQDVLDRIRSSGNKINNVDILNCQGSVQAVTDCFGTLAAILKEDGSAVALSILKQISTFKFLYIAHFLTDILPHFDNVRRALQKPNLLFTDINPLLLSTVQNIEKLTTHKSGQNLLKFIRKVPGTPVVGRSGMVTFEFEDCTIKDGVSQRTEAESAFGQFGSILLSSLIDRFLEKRDVAILSALTRLFEPSLIVARSDVLFVSAEVVARYLDACAVGTEKFARQEIEGFLLFAKVQITGNRKVFGSIKDVIELALRNKRNYPMICHAAERLFMVPSCTVDNDKVLDYEGLMQNGTNRNVTRLEDSMRIIMDGTPTHQFDFEAALRYC